MSTYLPTALSLLKTVAYGLGGQTPQVKSSTTGNTYTSNLPRNLGGMTSVNVQNNGLIDTVSSFYDQVSLTGTVKIVVKTAVTFKVLQYLLTPDTYKGAWRYLTSNDRVSDLTEDVASSALNLGESMFHGITAAVSKYVTRFMQSAQNQAQQGLANLSKPSLNGDLIASQLRHHPVCQSHEELCASIARNYQEPVGPWTALAVASVTALALGLGYQAHKLYTQGEEEVVTPLNETEETQTPSEVQ